MTKQGKPTAESSALWQRAFGEEGSDENVSRLVASLRVVRRNVGALTSRIAVSLPGLTIHDVSHLDALWEVASTVAGSDFPLNPVEAYVFGAAVLLHDAALCSEAYSGGREGLRETLAWRDAYGRLSRTAKGIGDLDQEADFEALRALHASQAARLAVEPWRDDEGELYLIDDRELRENYGQLIGDLASSHHWNIEMVVRRFRTPRPAAAFFQADWIVDSLKIACMLRIADAGHMDGSRAPSFLLRVLQMNSLSRAHWRAQNHLGKLTVRRDDPTQLVIASMRPFLRSQSTAWWVAFDLIETFDTELRRCNEVLRTSPGGPRTTFTRRSVAGAGRVRELVQYVETVDWEPTDSTVHVSDVGELVTNLGGDQLYGKDADRLHVALRELIQNAADAIGVRRSLPGCGEFAGRIVVRLNGREDGGWILRVDDNGVGMSRTTLTTDLLDFGRSFWASERAAREFPGVHASGYTPIGRFGIGFFSVFMAAARVDVFTRRYDKGLDHVRSLSFENGLSLRPTLSARKPGDMGMELSTRVEVELKPGVVEDPERIPIRCSIQGHEDFAVTFEGYVAAMVSGIDVPVFVERAGRRRRVHERFPPDPGRQKEWLQTLSYVNAGVNQAANAGLTRALPRLREIRDDHRCYGLAALDVLGRRGGVFVSGKAVGGLVQPHARYHDPFVGLIDHLPATAGRAAGETAAPSESIARWMSEQIRLLSTARLSKEESIVASYSVCELGFDPLQVLQGLWLSSQGGVAFAPLGQIANHLRNGGRLGFPILHSVENHLDSHSGQLTIPDIWSCVVMKNGKFNHATLSSEVPSEPNSLVGVVHRVLDMAGEKPTWSRLDNAYHNNLLGPGYLLEVRL